jgi:hypothetical protein
MGPDTPFLILLTEFEDPRRVEDKQNRPPHIVLFAISAAVSGSSTEGSTVSSMRISPACGSSLALNGTGLQHDPHHSPSVAPSIIWTVLRPLSRVAAKASAAMRQRRRQARNCSCRRSGARDRSA